MCIEREKVNFKSREINCLKECALALKCKWDSRDIESIKCGTIGIKPFIYI